MHSFTPRIAIFVAAALVVFWFIMPARIFPMYSDKNIPVMIGENSGAHGEADTHFHSSTTSATLAETTTNPSSTSSSQTSDDPPKDGTKETTKTQALSAADIYFDQTFSLQQPAHEYDFPALREQCERTTWKTRNTQAASSEDVSSGDSDNNNNSATSSRGRAAVYLQCEGIYLGLTSVISQVKSCLRMAIDAGAGVILPNIPLRDADNLMAYNQGNPAAERAFGDWFDEAHLVGALARACPGLDVVAPRDLEGEDGGPVVRAEDHWAIDVHAARFFRERDGFFWAGKPFGAFFDEEFARLREERKAAGMVKDGEKTEGEGGAEGELQRRRDARGVEAAAGSGWEWEEGRGPVVVGMRADFELFNVANDPTGHDRYFWDDLGRALRFLPEPRAIVDRLLRQISLGAGAGSDEQQQQQQPPYFAVHFRGEGDNMWASAEEQIRVDLDALDRAWALYGDDPALTGTAAGGGSSSSSSKDKKRKKPPVYLACGDEGSLKAFVEAGKARGWEVTSKYALARAMGGTETHDMIEALPFDFQAIIDLGMLVRSYFFIGIMGSAFSYTTANVRDPLTRYRGSSFEVLDDGGARTHMFPNADRHGDATMEKYACCL